MKNPPIFALVPTLNEENHLAILLARLNAMPQIARVVVCDGGSVDGTLEVAQSFGVDVVLAARNGDSRNRGAQMNAGVAALKELDEDSSADAILWFLHADAQPHENSGASLLRAARNQRVLGGNFRLRFDDVENRARAFEGIARAMRRFGMYYGDSGIWLRRSAFEQLGGFQTWPLFEDYDLARRLETLARKNHMFTLCLAPPLLASARRFQNCPLRTLGIWALLQVLFWFGVAPRKLAQIYHR